MVDNTTVNTGTGDSIRDIDRSGSGPKTQVVQLDFGGAAPNAEQLVSANNPMPIYDQWRSVHDTLSLQNLLVAQSGGGNGFIPMETPSFLVGG